MFTEQKNNFSLFDFSKYRTELMGLAIIMVVFHHLTLRTSVGLLGKGYMFLRVTGAMGVDIFLFLSGLGLFYSFRKNPDIKAFYKKRLIRIIPTYVLICAPFYAFKYLIGTNFDIKGFLLHLSLISYWIDGSCDWYIAAIIVLYALFPLFYRVMKNNRLSGFIILIAIWGLISFTVFLISPSVFHNTETFWPRIPIFLFGVYMGKPILDKKATTKNIVLYSAIVNILVLAVEAYYCLQGASVAYSFWPRLFYFPLCLSLMFMVCFMFELFRLERTRHLLKFFGGITLEIYLLNQRFIDIFSNNIHNLIISNIVGILLTIILSWIIHSLVNMVISKLGVMRK